MGTRRPDSYFRFKPGNGIHDIHMNQGNVENGKVMMAYGKTEEYSFTLKRKKNGLVSFLHSNHSHGVPMKKGMLAFLLSIVIIRIINKKRAFKRTPSSYIKRKPTSVEIQEKSSATLENAMRYILYFITCPISWLLSY